MDAYTIDSLTSSVDAEVGTRMTLQANGTLAIAGNTTVASGTLARAAKANQLASLMLYGPLRQMIAGGAIAIGDALTTAASGRVTQAAGPTSGLWTAKTAATAAGQLIWVLPREK